MSTFTVFALQIAISGLQCYFPIHKVWGQPGALQALLLFLLHKTTNETIYICMYVHCIGYRQRSVSVVMAPEPHSKSGFNLFCSVYLKREKILLEIYSKVHEWIFFLRSHDFCLSNSSELSNSSPIKKNIKTFAPWYSQEKYFCQMWLHGTSGIYGFCLTKWSMTSQRLKNLQLWADSNDRRARRSKAMKRCFCDGKVFWQIVTDENATGRHLQKRILQAFKSLLRPWGSMY